MQKGDYTFRSFDDGYVIIRIDLVYLHIGQFATGFMQGAGWYESILFILDQIDWYMELWQQCSIVSIQQIVMHEVYDSVHVIYVACRIVGFIYYCVEGLRVLIGCIEDIGQNCFLDPWEYLVEERFVQECVFCEVKWYWKRLYVRWIDQYCVFGSIGVFQCEGCRYYFIYGMVNDRGGLDLKVVH